MSATPRPNAVLIGYDGSEAANAAIDGAGRLLRGHAAVVLNVYESPQLPIVPTAAPGVAAPPAVMDPERMDAAEEQAASNAQRIAEDGARLATAAGLQATPEARMGEGGTTGVWSMIVDTAAELAAEAIVVGSRGRSGIKAALLGSVSNGVIHHADRPVLVVRAPEHHDGA